MTVLFLLFLLCLAGSFFFSGIETGVIACHRIRLRALAEQGVKHMATLEFFNAHPDRLLGTTLVGNNICNITLSVMAARWSAHWGGPWGEIASSALLTLIILVFCEYIPKAWFQGNPIDRARPFAPVLNFCAVTLRPLAALIMRVSNLFLPAALNQPTTPRPLISKEELDLLAKESADRGILSPRQRIMIRRVVDLAGKMAAQIMIPRPRMVVVEQHITARNFLKQAYDSHLTRLPVWNPELKQFVGIANLFDILALPPDSLDEPIERFMRPPQFINAATPLTEIFPRMRSSRQPLGLVVDTHSEVVGLITTEDILNQIVGTA